MCVWILLCGQTDEYPLIYCTGKQSNYANLDLFVKWKVKVIKFSLFYYFLFLFFVEENATSLH